MERRHRVDILSLTAWQMMLGAVPLVVVAMLADARGPDWTAAFARPLAYNVILANAVAWLLWLYALQHLTAGAAGLRGRSPCPSWVSWRRGCSSASGPAQRRPPAWSLIIGALAIISVRGLIVGRRRPAGAAPEEPAVRPVTD